MKKPRALKMLVIIGILSVILPAQGVAWGNAIPIVNASFEDDSPPAGGTTPWLGNNSTGAFNRSINGWRVIADSAGTWMPPTGMMSSTMSAGPEPRPG